VVLLLTGGDKSSQQADIKRAGKLWAEWQRRQRDEKFKASRSHHAGGDRRARRLKMTY
jgi:hypothetical protein